MESVIENLLSDYPILTQVIVIVGLLRIIFKPLMSSIQKHVEITESNVDNERLYKFMSSKWYLILSFIFDLSASIKLPKIKKDNK